MASLIVANLSLILTNRSWSRTILATVQAPNPALWWVLTGAIAFMGLVLYVSVLRHLFHFSVLHPLDLRFPVTIVLCSSLFVIIACSSLPTSTSKIEETVKSRTDRVQSTIERTHSEADRAVQSTSERVRGAIAFELDFLLPLASRDFRF